MLARVSSALVRAGADVCIDAATDVAQPIQALSHNRARLEYMQIAELPWNIHADCGTPRIGVCSPSLTSS
eukprot:11318684-Heterocapsa_arctica.AAC.1